LQSADEKESSTNIIVEQSIESVELAEQPVAMSGAASEGIHVVSASPESSAEQLESPAPGLPCPVGGAAKFLSPVQVTYLSFDMSI